MPSGAEIHQYLNGVWRMMLGREDGLKLLDLSVDGFWNSFYAIVVAIPPLMVGWVAVANNAPEALTFGIRLSIVLRLAASDLAAWLVPLAMLGAIVRPAGIADRFVHYVVASNWANALFAWFMVPAALLRLFAPGAQELIVLLSLVLFMATLVLLWRLTVVAIARGAAVGSAVFFSMLVASFAMLILLQSLLGLQIQ